MLKNNYKHIFFDLDHTLWDFENNASAVLLELHQELNLSGIGCTDPQLFIDTFHEVNKELWKLHDLNQIDIHNLRISRFTRVFGKMGLNQENVPDQLGDLYLERCPKGKLVLPYAHEVLKYLHGKYSLHVITNGFEEIQQLKLKSAGLFDFFNEIITAEGSGFKKPYREIFDYAFQKTGGNPGDSLMIGDNLETDISGARNCGMDHIFFNPGRVFHDQPVDHEIFCLSELKELI